MFFRGDETFRYLIGVLILFFALIYLGINVYLPFINSPSTFNINLNGTQISPPNREYISPSNPIKTAKITTSVGDIYIRLFGNIAPKNVNNFIYLAISNYYNGVRFHRAIDGFMIQGGDRNSLNSSSQFIGRGNTGYFIIDEVNWDSLDLNIYVRDELSKKGYQSTPGLETPRFSSLMVGMASSGPNTNSSQFFIISPNVSDSDNRLMSLNGRFTPIGRVISGSDTILNIENSITNLGKMIVIEKIEILDQ
jgi:cyclophilin family peptidyl-prolyl cis-trans isomerase